MYEANIKSNIELGLEQLTKNSQFPPDSILDNDRYLSAYAFTDIDYRIFDRWLTVIMEVKAIDTSRSFFIPCILRKIPERIYSRRVNDIYYDNCSQFSLNESYIEDLEIELNEKYLKILGENNFLKAVCCKNGELKERPKYSTDNDMSAVAMKLNPRKCNLAFYPYLFSKFAYTSDANTWNTELIEKSIFGDESFQDIKRLSKQYFTINDVSLGTFVSTLSINDAYGIKKQKYQNAIMKCTCNSLSLTFYDNTTLSAEEIEKAAIAISADDPDFNKAFIIDCQDKKFEEVNEFFDGEQHKLEIKKEKKEEKKLNIVITNDELLI
mgnify:FL=1